MPKSATCRTRATVEQQIGGLDVAVQDAPAVGVIEGRGGLVDPVDRMDPADRIDPQRVGDGPAGQVLHDDERPRGLPAGRVRLADVVDHHDVRMSRQTRGGARLAHEALRRVIVVGEALGQELDRHVAAQRLVAGAPHRRHAARRDVAQGLITFREPQVRADACGRRGSITHRNASLPAVKNTNRGGL